MVKARRFADVAIDERCRLALACPPVFGGSEDYVSVHILYLPWLMRRLGRRTWSFVVEDPIDFFAEN
jgi:hypothetical protein